MGKDPKKLHGADALCPEQRAANQPLGDSSRPRLRQPWGGLMASHEVKARPFELVSLSHLPLEGLSEQNPGLRQRTRIDMGLIDPNLRVLLNA